MGFKTSVAIYLTLSVGLVSLAAPAAAATDTLPMAGASLAGNYLAGRHAQVERDMEAATAYFGAALDMDPDRPELVRQTFLLMLTEGRMPDAVALAKRSIQINGDDVIAKTTLALDHIRAERYGEALKLLEAMPVESLNIFIVPPLKAWCLVGLGDKAAALKALETHKDSPGNHLFTLHRGVIQDLAGKTDDAVKTMNSLTEDRVGMSLRVAEILGGILERKGNRQDARDVYERYLADQPQSKLLDESLRRLEQPGAPAPDPVIRTPAQGAAEAMFGLASSLRQQNTGDTALVFARLALWLRPDFPAMQIILADILESDGRIEAAIEVYRSIHPNSPFQYPSMLQTATNLSQLDRYAEAATLLNKLGGIDPKDPEPMIRLGNLYRMQEKYEDAITAYNQAFDRVGELGPESWFLLYARGIAYERTKQWPKAEADFLKALDFEPDNPRVLNYLGYSWVDMGMHLDRALGMIRKAVHLRPNDGYIVDSLGWAYYRLKRYEDAVVELERAVELRPHDPIINDHLGDALWRVGRKMEARFQWERALTMKPDAEVEAALKKKLEKGLDAAEGNGT